MHAAFNSACALGPKYTLNQLCMCTGWPIRFMAVHCTCWVATHSSAKFAMLLQLLGIDPMMKLALRSLQQQHKSTCMLSFICNLEQPKQHAPADL
jgi:hypothetical protein